MDCHDGTLNVERSLFNLVRVFDSNNIYFSATSQALLEANSGILALKKRGLRVIRSRVTPVSRLLGRTAVDVNFRAQYKAAIVAVQRGGKNIGQPLSTVVFESGDALILQASEDSPLLHLTPPTADFYQKLEEEAALPSPRLNRPPSYKALVNLVKLPNLARRPSFSNGHRRSNSDQNSITGGSTFLKEGSKSFNDVDDPPERAVDEDDDFFIRTELEDGTSSGVPTGASNDDPKGPVSRKTVHLFLCLSHTHICCFGDACVGSARSDKR